MMKSKKIVGLIRIHGISKWLTTKDYVDVEIGERKVEWA
jgi:hypothetical protein